jgi:hypothetical protein
VRVGPVVGFGWVGVYDEPRRGLGLNLRITRGLCRGSGRGLAVGAGVGPGVDVGSGVGGGSGVGPGVDVGSGVGVGCGYSPALAVPGSRMTSIGALKPAALRIFRNLLRDGSCSSNSPV